MSLIFLPPRRTEGVKQALDRLKTSSRVQMVGVPCCVLRAAAGSHGADGERCWGHGGPQGHTFHRSPPVGGHPYHTECKTSLSHTQALSHTHTHRHSAPGSGPRARALTRAPTEQNVTPQRAQHCTQVRHHMCGSGQKLEPAFP